MNSDKLLEFYKSALLAHKGLGDYDTVQRLAEAIENAYRRGLAEGANVTTTASFDDGYEKGYNDGINNNQPEINDPPYEGTAY